VKFHNPWEVGVNNFSGKNWIQRDFLKKEGWVLVNNEEITREVGNTKNTLLLEKSFNYY